MRSPLLPFALCCALSLALGPVSAFAQSEKNDSGDKDMAELQHYTLTMAKVNAYAEIFGDLKALAKAHPELKDKLAGDSADSLSASEHRIASQPQVVAVLLKHSFTPREFVVFGVALFQSAFAEATAKQNGIDPGKAAAEAHVNPANMTFVAQHKTELEAVMAKMKEASDKDSSDN